MNINNNCGFGYGGRERGVALIAVLLLAAVIVTVALVAAYTARMDLRIAYNQYRSLQALYTADAGLNHAFRILALNPTGFDTILAGNGVGGVFTTLGTTTVHIASLDYRFRNFPNLGPGNDGYYVRLQDNFDETPNDPTHDADGEITIISRGQSGDAVRVVEGVVKRTGFCLFGTTNTGDGITMSGGASLVDSYNSALGAYAATAGSNAKVGTNASVDASGGSTFGGDVSAVGIINLHPGTVTGTQTPGADPQSFTSVPACGPYSGSTGISGGTYNSTTGNLGASGGGNITLAAGTYCFNNITLSGGSTLTINSGPVIINLTGTLDFSGGSVANNTLLPTNLRFSSSYSGSSKIKLSGGSGAYMTVYAPAADIDISGGSGFFGSIIGRTLTFSGGSRIHCDLSAPGGSGGLRLIAWHQLR